MNLNPEAAVIFAGDVNHVELKAVLPKYRTFAHFPNRLGSSLQHLESVQGHSGAPHGQITSVLS